MVDCLIMALIPWTDITQVSSGTTWTVADGRVLVTNRWTYASASGRGCVETSTNRERVELFSQLPPTLSA